MDESFAFREVERTRDEKPGEFRAWRGKDITTRTSLQSLEEFNVHFSRYVNRTRTFDGGTTSFGRQLESLRQVKELSGLEEVFTEQIQQNQQRIWDLHNELNCLEQELKEAQRALDEYRTSYRTECEHQENLQDTVVTLMKDTNEALLKNLELQVRTQFLQEDIDTTKERNMKNLSEIQSYMNVLKQVHPPTSNDYPTPASSEAAEQDGPAEGHYMDKVQSYNEQIDDLRKKTEEAALSLEQCANECHQVVMYQHSLENELERYKRFVADDDYRLQSPVSEEESSVLHAGSPCGCEQDAPEGKGVKSIDVLSSDAGEEEGVPGKYSEVNVRNGDEEDKEEGDGVWDVGLDDVPDGAQISRVYDALCNMVRERMKKHRRPEVPAATFYTKGHQVLVTGEASYTDPFFCALVPARSQVIVTFEDQHHPDPTDFRPQPDPAEPPSYNGGSSEGESGHDSDGEKAKDKAEDKKPDDTKSDANREPKKPPISPPVPLPAPPPSAPEPPQPADNKPAPISGPSVPNPDPGGSDDLGSKLPAYHKEHKPSEQQNRLMAPSQPPPSDDRPPKEPKYKYYEKIEMIEAVETFTDNKLQGYEETSTIVETTVEKTKQDMNAKI